MSTCHYDHVTATYLTARQQLAERAAVISEDA